MIMLLSNDHVLEVAYVSELSSLRMVAGKRWPTYSKSTGVLTTFLMKTSIC